MPPPCTLFAPFLQFSDDTKKNPLQMLCLRLSMAVIYDTTVTVLWQYYVTSIAMLKPDGGMKGSPVDNV